MLLKSLSEAMGPSGFEHEVRDVIRQHTAAVVDCQYTDVLGNLYCEQSTHQQGPRVMVDAHMDEVGLMIVHAEDGGLLKFRPVGGIDLRILVSKPVLIGKNKVPGVIGAKPIHLQTDDERKKPLTIDQLYIDIGANDRYEALGAVQLGDYVTFATSYGPIGDRCVKGKSFDDRVGCALLVDLLNKRTGSPLTAVFTVQEEVGLRGATVAAQRLNPDIAIALEGTVCYDVVGVPSHGQGTVLGKGPALTLIDSRTIPDKRFLEFMVAVAEKEGIPYQFRRIKGGSNDYGIIHKTRAGIIGGAISVPVRYIHAPTQILSLEDYANSLRLIEAIVVAIRKGEFTDDTRSDH